MKARQERELLQVWMPPALFDRLKVAAAADGLTVALYVRRLLTRKLKVSS